MIKEVTSKITTKNQTTIPKQVRNILQVGPEDTIKYVINADGLVSIYKDNKENDMWAQAYQQEKKYGSFDTPEVDWGTDIESKEFD